MDIDRPLPTFNNPPVVELAVSVEFGPLAAFKTPHFGLFWSQIRAEYPRMEVQPPIISTSQSTLDPLVILPRCWFMDESGARLVQLQNDRVIYNWRKMAQGTVYPHYGTIRPVFEDVWTRFLTFLATEAIPLPMVQACEVTYVNQIELSTAEPTKANLLEVFPSWAATAQGSVLGQATPFALDATYVMPEQAGQVRLIAQPGLRQVDAQVVCQLTLTARGTPPSSSGEHIRAWLDMGHMWVVRAFTDITSKEMHAKWRRGDPS